MATLLASFPLKDAAVTTYVPSSALPQHSSSLLLVTTFAPFGKEPLYAVPWHAQNATPSFPVTLDADSGWTNYVDVVPDGALPGEPSATSTVIATAGGFLVPGHSTGSIVLSVLQPPLSTPNHTKISTDKRGWFYHKIVWHDCSGDGRLDVFAARAYVPNLGAKKGELICLEQPPAGALSGAKWRETLLTAGPDVDFVLSAHTAPPGGPPAVVAAQYFSSPQLTHYVCGRQTWIECAGGEGVVSTVLDDEMGPFFAVQEADLDGDGAPDLLVANSRADRTGALLAYSTTTSAAVNYSRRVLASGYAPVPKPFAGPGRGAPGTPFALGGAASAGRPRRILLSGDDGGFVSLLTPTAAKTAGWEWTYEEAFVVNSSGTIGEVSWTTDERSGDEIAFIPFYSEGRVEAWALP